MLENVCYNTWLGLASYTYPKRLDKNFIYLFYYIVSSHGPESSKFSLTHDQGG